VQGVLRFVPGGVGAIAAFGVSKLLAWTDLSFDLGVFLVTYLVITIVVDRGLAGYGRGPRKS